MPYQFKPRQSGNPRGRPLKDPVENATRNLMNMSVPDMWPEGKYLEPLKGGLSVILKHSAHNSHTSLPAKNKSGLYRDLAD